MKEKRDFNDEQVNFFLKGWSADLNDDFEKQETFISSLNGRLYSENGVLSYVSLKGTVENVFSNINIVKYLGCYAFKDELICFVKYNGVYNISSETRNVSAVKSNNITAVAGSASTTVLPLFSIINSAVSVEYVSPNFLLDNDYVNPLNKTNYSLDVQTQLLDLSKYYKLSNINTEIPNASLKTFTVDELSPIPLYNKTYSDAIISIRYNNINELEGVLLWNGYLNWDINRKITAFGNDEGLNQKRVYFTDNLNPFRSFNLKDNELISRKAFEFDVQQYSSLLQPEISFIGIDGQLKAMSVQYAYRLISANGQVTPFSPFSEIVLIVKDDNGNDFEGGEIGTLTNKSVMINCNIIQPKLFKEVELIAICFETSSTPSNIVSLGRQDVDSIVTFVHRGSEALFDVNITIFDIVDFKYNWKYCNTITAKNNKLIVGGLRNEPYPFDLQTIEDLFLLKGWDSEAHTHAYLINTQPDVYRYIDPALQTNFIYVKKRLFTSFLVFGDFTITFYDVNNLANIITKTFNNTADVYIEYINEIYDWLSVYATAILFPNLAISMSGANILFTSSNELDINDYVFKIDTKQSIIAFDNEYAFYLNESVPSINNLVDGAVSYGFYKGDGVRLSWRETKEPVLTKNNVSYANGPILNLETPTLLKSFMKDEIYRLSIQFFKSGKPLFSIVLGDIQAPAIGDLITYIDDNGNPVKTTRIYVNQSVEEDTLYAHRLQLKVEVRTNSFINDFADSYQIQYVKRDENNRTVLAQGISAPLVRIVKYENANKSGEDLALPLFRKWTLPFMGGPVYPVHGLTNYDSNGEEFDVIMPGDFPSGTSSADIKKRIITNRKMFYFDSPDLIYNVISADNISNSDINVLGTVTTDEDHNSFMNGADIGYPKFSRQIKHDFLAGDTHATPHFVNISVFSNFRNYQTQHNIDKATKLLNKGEVLSSGVLGTNFPASNNALSLSIPNWYYDDMTLDGDLYSGDIISELLQSCQISQGYPTVFIRTEDNVFTDELIGSNVSFASSTLVWGSDIAGPKPIIDTHAIINLKLRNTSGVYGGRNKYAYSKNVFTPLGAVTPLYPKTNQSQKTIINGDIYVSLFLRTKNDYSNGLRVIDKPLNLRHDKKGRNNNGDEQRNVYLRGSAWAYAVVLETEIESRLTDSFRFYKSTGNDFSIEVKETIPDFYLKKDDLRLFSPRPHNFKDDPLLFNIVSGSKTKLNGDFYDAWTDFPVNSFYELSRDKGVITNIFSWQDDVYVIQEKETNLLKVSGVEFVNTAEGSSISVRKGDEQTFLIHKKVNDYGTSFRRNLVETPFGYAFFDEKKIEFIYNGQPLLIKNSLNLEMRRLISLNKINDIEGFYDEKNKEINFIITLSNATFFCISYNIALEVFNGLLSYDNVLYLVFDDKIFAPVKNNPTSLSQLNEGPYLNFFGTQKTMFIKVVVNKYLNINKILKATAIFLNINYGIKSITLTDSKGNVRTVLPTHPVYKIREGKHSVPFLNSADTSFLRDKVATVEYEFDAINGETNNKISVYSVINYIRKSFN